MTKYVVRSDVGVRSTWITTHWLYSDELDVTERPERALVFHDAGVAQRVADEWSSSMGVWRVVVRAQTQQERTGEIWTEYLGVYAGSRDT